jgi:hypothetical protein
MLASWNMQWLACATATPIDILTTNPPKWRLEARKKWVQFIHHEQGEGLVREGRWQCEVLGPR